MGYKSITSEQVAFIARKINYLFETIRSPSGQPYTAEAVQEGTGIDASYIRRMRNGKIGRPGREVLEALSTFFHIKPEYWFRAEDDVPPDTQVPQHLSVIIQKLKMGNFSPDQLRLIAGLIDIIQHSFPGEKAPPLGRRAPEQHPL